MAGKALLKQGEDRRKAIVAFIRKYRERNGYSPTIGEIASAVGLGSPNATRHHLLILQRDGVITMDTRVGRSIAIVEDEMLLTFDEVAMKDWPANTRFLVRKAQPKRKARAKVAVAA